MSETGSLGVSDLVDYGVSRTTSSESRFHLLTRSMTPSVTFLWVSFLLLDPPGISTEYPFLGTLRTRYGHRVGVVVTGRTSRGRELDDVLVWCASVRGVG